MGRRAEDPLGNFSALRAGVAKLAMKTMSVVGSLFRPIFSLLTKLSPYEPKLQLIIRLTSYCINTFGVIAVLYILFLLIFASIMRIAKMINKPDTANSMATTMETMMMFKSRRRQMFFIF